MIVVGPGVVEWVSTRLGTDTPLGKAVGIGWQSGDKLVGAVAYDGFNGPNIQMHVASDGSGHWLNRKFLNVIFDYPFNQVKVKRITGLVGEDNLAARRFDEHIGFELEAKLRGAHPGGDLFIYVMWRHQCRWINENLYPCRMRVAA